jgi:hypothetical protein
MFSCSVSPGLVHCSQENLTYIPCRRELGLPDPAEGTTLVDVLAPSTSTLTRVSSSSPRSKKTAPVWRRYSPPQRGQRISKTVPRSIRAISLDVCKSSSRCAVNMPGGTQVQPEVEMISVRETPGEDGFSSHGRKSVTVRHNLAQTQAGAAARAPSLVMQKYPDTPMRRTRSRIPGLMPG